MKIFLKFLNFIFAKFHVNLFIMILQEFLINLFNIHLSNIICIQKKFSFIIISNSIANNFLNDYIVNSLNKLKYKIIFSNLLFSLIVYASKFHLKSFLKADSLPNSYFHKNDKKEFDFSIDLNKHNSSLNKIKYSDFICFMTRDESYLKKKYPKIDWSYHSYRNSDPINLKKIILALVKQNIYCLRVGTIYEKDFDINSEFYIDYANKFRSEPLDFFVSRYCKLFICDTSGIIYLPLSQNSNILRYNCNLFDLFKPFNSTLSIPVLYASKKNDKLISFNEAIQNKVYLLKNSKLLNESDYKIIYNTPDLIFNVTNEVLKYGTNFINDEHIKLNNDFYKLFDNHSYKMFHNSQQRYNLDDKCILPLYFLKKYKYLYFNEK